MRRRDWAPLAVLSILLACGDQAAREAPSTESTAGATGMDGDGVGGAAGMTASTTGAAATDPGAAGSIAYPGGGAEAAENPHQVSPTTDASGHTCYAAFDSPRTCEEGFERVSACSPSDAIGLLRGGLEARGRDEGCYYFCPDVPDCAELTMDEVARLACQFAAENDISPALSLRSVCGVETDTGFGPCCFGLDANTLFD